MRKIFNLFRSRRLEAELDRELSYHVERRVDELIASGVSQPEARRQVLIEFGGVSQVQEEVRDIWISRWLHNLGHDVLYALRVLRGSPGFTATAVLSLALGIGANTAMFSILHALVLRSLPVADPHRLVVVIRGQVSSPYPWFVELQQQARSLSGVLAFRTTPCRFDAIDGPERITAVLVSGSYFDVLGVVPALGTAIRPEDDAHPGSGGGRGPVAVLGHSFWLRKYGGEPSAIGKQIRLNGQLFTVAGIAPQSFNGVEVGETPDVYLTMAMQEVLLPGLGNALQLRRSNWIRIVGRLKPDTAVALAEAELTTIVRRYNLASMQTGEAMDPTRRRALLEQRITLEPGNGGISPLRQQYAKPLWVLMTVVGLVLLIACTNVANLLLSRAAVRRREIAIRLGLGAARSRLVCQLLTESLVLGLAGATSGLLLARWLRDILTSYLPPERSLAVPIDLNALWFTLVVAVFAVVLFGLVPALQTTRLDLAPALKGEAGSARSAPAFFRKALIVFQMGLSCLMLIAAALFLRSLHNLMTIDPGFERQNLLVASVDADLKLFPRLLEAVQHLPGVSAAALADSPPLGTHTGWTIFAPGYTPGPAEDSPSVGFISPGYFEVMKIPIVAGRDFDQRDVNSRREVMMVNESFAKAYFEGVNPVGRRVGTTAGTDAWEIVGIVKDSKYSGLRDRATRMVYVPYRPGPWASHMVIHLRTAAAPSVIGSAVRRTVRDIDRNAPVFNVHTVQEEMDRSLLRERLVGGITGLFGAVALLLAALGLYGLVAYSVSRRTREFGIRMAVGAGAASIVRQVLREALWLLAAGIALGLAAAWAVGRIVSSLLFGLLPTDLLSMGAAVAALAAATLLAAWIPARRAARVDPNLALRSH